jgi:hypothetical protein
MYKIQWSHHTEEEAMWETEDYLNTKYPGFLQSQNREFFSPSFRYQSESRDEIPFKGGVGVLYRQPSKGSTRSR